jgi:predicted Zn-dependent protease
MQGQLNFSRDMEREADRVGFAVMTGAGFQPAGMAEMFELLEKSSRLNDSGGFPYLRSHPLTSARIGEARSRSSSTPAAAPVSVLEHTVAEARARVLMDPRVEALQRWQRLDPAQAAAPSEKLAAAYSSGLASSRLRDWSRADASFAQALALVRASPGGNAQAERAIVLTEVESQLARGAPQQAATTLQPYTGESSRPVLLLQSEVTLAAPPDEAALKRSADELQTWVALHAGDATAWTTLGQVWGKLGQPLRSLRAEAESRVAVGDLLGATDRLRAAQQVARRGNADFIDASVIDSRLRDIEQQRKQQEADEKAMR